MTPFYPSPTQNILPFTQLVVIECARVFTCVCAHACARACAGICLPEGQAAGGVPGKQPAGVSPALRVHMYNEHHAFMRLILNLRYIFDKRLAPAGSRTKCNGAQTYSTASFNTNRVLNWVRTPRALNAAQCQLICRSSVCVTG